jgi:hypothetical protein
MTTLCATMNITKKVVLALVALAVASFPLVTEGCNGQTGHQHHAHDDHHLQNTEEDCSEDSVGRRLALPIRCDTAEPSVTMLRKIPSIIARWKQRVGANRRLVTEIINIPVYFHIIKRDDESGGGVTDQQILDQITILNESYTGHFAFNLAGITMTLNSSWYTTSSGSQSATEMKTALKVGGIDTLNIYTVDPSNGALGWVSCVVSWLSCRLMSWCTVGFGCLDPSLSRARSNLSLFLLVYIRCWSYCRRRHRWCGGSLLNFAWR